MASSTANTPARTHKSMRAESDARIISAAIEAFADRGYHRTTLNQIGAEAGFTGALISNRYGSKAGLARAVFMHILGRLTPVGAEGERARSYIDENRSARAQFDDFIARYMQDAVGEPRRLRALYVLIGESLGGMDEIDDEVAEVNRVFRGHIAGYVRARSGAARVFGPTLMPTKRLCSPSARSGARSPNSLPSPTPGSIRPRSPSNSDAT